jgi:glutamyl-tRNA reductase
VDLLARILGLDALMPHEYYRLRGFAAFAHVVEVVAGMGSQTLGEEHIQGQLRQATARAHAAGWCNGMIGEWMAAAQPMAKEARRAAMPHLQAQDIEDRCAGYVRTALAGRDQARILIIGAGAIGTGTIVRLAPQFPCLWCYRSTLPEIPAHLEHRIRRVPLAELATALPIADAIICAADSQRVLSVEHLAEVQDGACVVDLGMPRNIPPELAAMLAPRIVDLDALADWHRHRSPDATLALAAVRAIIAQHLDAYDALMHRFQGGNPR